MRTPAAIITDYMRVNCLNAASLAAMCDPEITGQSVRNVLSGQQVGRKVALALARLIPELTIEGLLDPPKAGKAA